MRQSEAELSRFRMREKLIGKHPERFVHSPNWRDGVFHNLDAGDRDARSIVRWLRTRSPQAWPTWLENDAVDPPVERLSTSMADWSVHFVNHATVLWQIGPYNLLTDPVWSMRVSPFRWIGPRRIRPPGITLQSLPPIDLILLSHNHYDHMDLDTLAYLHERDRPLVLTGLGNGYYLRRRGITHVHELDWWQHVDWNGLNIHYVPSQHFSGRGTGDRNQALWGGFVVDSPHGSGYFAGDTGWGSHFEAIARRWPDFRLGLLPIGAYEPRWFMRPVHINPEEAVQAHKLLRIQTSVAIHHRTFQLTDESVDQPAHDLANSLEMNSIIPDAFWVLREGQRRIVR